VGGVGMRRTEWDEGFGGAGWGIWLIVLCGRLFCFWFGHGSWWVPGFLCRRRQRFGWRNWGGGPAEMGLFCCRVGVVRI